jgi:hypothetical protein
MSVSYSYISGTEPSEGGSTATILFNGTNNSPSSYNNLGANPSDYKTIGFKYVATEQGILTFNLTPNQGSINVYYIISENPVSSTQNFDASTYYTNSTGLNTTNLGIIDTNWTTISDSTTVDISSPANYYVSIIFSKNGSGSGSITASSSVCFYENTLVLMANKTYKEIKNIKKYDEIITNIKNNEIKKVSRNVCSFISNNNIYKIPKGLLNNNNDIIATGNHPVWMNDNNRCLIKNINGVIKINHSGFFYTLQFDEESTFYVEGIRVDSLSPYHRKIKLDKYNFIDEKKFIDNYVVNNENDKKRNKPILIYNDIKPKDIQII